MTPRHDFPPPGDAPVVPNDDPGAADLVLGGDITHGKRLHTGPARYGEDGDGLAWLERHAGTTGTCDVPWARGRGLG
jgi:hypothetical protein